MATFTKKISLENKVFSWENILQLFDAISKSVESIPNADQCISISCEDNYNVKYSSIREFRDLYICNYNIVRICYILRSSILDVELHLHADSPNFAEIKISGSEEQKVYALVEKIREIEKLIQPQKYTYLTRCLGMNAGVIFLSISLFLFWVIRICFSSAPIHPMIISIVVITIFFLSSKFSNWMCSTYPSVEFEFISDWKNTIKKRRTQMKWWFGAILLPLILAAAWDIIKWLWQ